MDLVLDFGFNQGEVVEGANRVLFCAGQTSVDADGTPQHPGDMAAQIALALDNLEAVLTGRRHEPGERRAAEHVHDRRGPVHSGRRRGDGVPAWARPG